MRRVLVEGWFGVPHSYCLLLENQVRHWVSDPRKDIRFRRLRPPNIVSARALTGTAALVDEAVRTRPWRGEAVSALYRASFPFDLSPPPSATATVFLFMTLEAELPKDAFFNHGGVRDFQRACAEGWLVPVVPSRWCADMLANLDLRRVEIVSLGVDTTVFEPGARRRPSPLVPFDNDRFVFLSVGAMTPNKGMGHLPRAFARVRRTHPGAVLVTKAARRPLPFV